jgi:hypothetical protein
MDDGTRLVVLVDPLGGADGRRDGPVRSGRPGAPTAGGRSGSARARGAEHVAARDPGRRRTSRSIA